MSFERREYKKPRVISDKIDLSKGIRVGYRARVKALDLNNCSQRVYVKYHFDIEKIKIISKLIKLGLNVELPLVNLNDKDNIEVIAGKHCYKQVVFLSAGIPLDEFLKTNPSKEVRLKIALSLAKQMALLISAGYTHNDLFFKNVAVRNNEAYLLDLENVSRILDYNNLYNLNKDLNGLQHIFDEILEYLPRDSVWAEFVNNLQLSDNCKNQLIEIIKTHCHFSKTIHNQGL